MSPSTIEAIKVLTDNSNPRHLDGWCWLDKAMTLCSYIEKERPSVVVDLGIFGGRSMIPMALQLRDNADGGVCYGIDPWTNTAALEGEHKPEDSAWWGKVNLNDVMMKFLWRIQELGLIDFAVPIRATSQAVHAIFPKESIDFLHIDSNHSELASLRDIALYVPKVRSGGLICLDDLKWESNKAAVDRLDGHCDRVQDIDGGPQGYARLYRKP